MSGYNAGIRGFAGIVALSLLSVALPSTAKNEIELQTVRIEATVRAACSVSMPSVVTMPVITYGPEMNDKGNAGSLIPGISTDITVTGSCSGSTKFKYTVTADGDANGCIAPAPRGAVGLCLYRGSDKISFSGGQSPILPNLTSGDTRLTVKAAYGDNPKVTDYTATLSVKIEPM